MVVTRCRLYVLKTGQTTKWPCTHCNVYKQSFSYFLVNTIFVSYLALVGYWVIDMVSVYWQVNKVIKRCFIKAVRLCEKLTSSTVIELSAKVINIILQVWFIALTGLIYFDSDRTLVILPFSRALTVLIFQINDATGPWNVVGLFISTYFVPCPFFTAVCWTESLNSQFVHQLLQSNNVSCLLP